jgi:hypothetical protein
VPCACATSCCVGRAPYLSQDLAPPLLVFFDLSSIPLSAPSPRSLRAAAALIRAEGGAVTAEQLAPLFSPAGLPPAALPADTISVGGGAISVEPTLVSEGWVTEALVGLGGEPIVTGASLCIAVARGGACCHSLAVAWEWDCSHR